MTSASHPSVSRHDIRGPNGRFIKPDRLDLSGMVAQREESESRDLRELMRERNPVADDAVPGTILSIAMWAVLIVTGLVIIGNVARF